MKKSKRKRLAKRGIKKGYRTLEKIIDRNVVDEGTVREINQHANLLMTANEYLDRAFKNE